MNKVLLEKDNCLTNIQIGEAQKILMMENKVFSGQS